MVEQGTFSVECPWYDVRQSCVVYRAYSVTLSFMVNGRANRACMLLKYG